MKNENIMEVKGLHKRFTSKGITVKAVTDVSFSVRPGETIGIVDPLDRKSGSGNPAAAKPLWDAVSSGPTTLPRGRSSIAPKPAKYWTS